MARGTSRQAEPDLFGHNEAKAPAAEEHWPPDDLRPGTLAEARQMAVTCTRCDLYKNATQTVFGEGPQDAEIMLVGEQPGDQEDLQGRPFVGAAGKVLDRALADAGIDRRKLYVTNGVKHFKNEPRGKKRLHKRPDISEIDVCSWWLDIERRTVKPKVIVAMGATGLRAVTGRSASIASMRGGKNRLADGTILIVTIHPSYLLRMPDRDAAELEYGRFVADLKAAVAAA
jgi:uracil-DNA glycosylase